jgi:chemotaxis protein CheC
MLATIANVLRRTMRMSLPSVIREAGLRCSIPNPCILGRLVMFLYIDFTIKHRDVRGFIALSWTCHRSHALKEIVRDFIGGLQEQSGNVG